MNKSILVFVAGAVTGAAATWFYAKKKYELIAQEEINSVKETLTARLNDYTNGLEPDPKEQEPETPEITEEDKEEYKEVLGTVNYSAYSDEPKKKSGKKNTKKNKEVEPVIDENEPYVIAPEEFGDDDDFETESLYYFADGHLTDDQYELIDDIEGMVSYNALEMFGTNEGDEDTVYVRNPQLKCDFEILQDIRNYADLREM